MLQRWIGGGLMIGGFVLVAFGAGISSLVGSVISGATMSLGMALIGVGALVLAIAGPAPLSGRFVRIGLDILAVGLLGVAGSSIAAARLSYDPLEDMPTVILLLGGGLAAIIGMLLTQLALLVAGGLARKLGVLFFAGLAGIYLMQSLAAISPEASPLRLVLVLSSVIAAAALLVGCAGPALLAFRGGRAPVVPG